MPPDTPQHGTDQILRDVPVEDWSSTQALKVKTSPSSFQSGHPGNATARPKLDQSFQSNILSTVDLAYEESHLEDDLLKQAAENLRPEWDKKTNPNAKDYNTFTRQCQDYGDAVEREYYRLKALRDGTEYHDLGQHYIAP
ncbi:hypothetical protein JCM17960_08280 [Magnetospira thiophila]